MFRPLGSIDGYISKRNKYIFWPSFAVIGITKKKLAALNKKSWIYCKPLIETYMSSIENRFDHFFNISSKIAGRAAIASLAHPLFKKRWLPCIDEVHRERILQLFTSALMEKIPGEPACQQATQKQGEGESSQRYLNFFDIGNNEELFSGDQVEIKAQMQIFYYFCDRFDELHSLDEYPAIKKVFFLSNTPLPSSAPVERLFSFASMTNAPQSNRLSDKNFELKVILNANLFKF